MSGFTHKEELLADGDVLVQLANLKFMVVYHLDRIHNVLSVVTLPNEVILAQTYQSLLQLRFERFSDAVT